MARYENRSTSKSHLIYSCRLFSLIPQELYCSRYLQYEMKHLFSHAYTYVLLISYITGLVGLSLSYAFALTGTQVFLSRWYSSLSNYIVSVERIKQYMHIPPQPPAVIPENRPPPSWPLKGRVELLDLKVVRNRTT